MLLRLMVAGLLGQASCAVIDRAAKRQDGTVPQYVLDYAPLIHLHSQDAWRPSDIQAHLTNSHATANGANVEGGPSPLTLDNLDQLNSLGGIDVYLSTNDDFTTGPQWIRGVTPDGDGKTQGAITATVIVHDKGDGNLDAFYLYFFSYNQGNKLFGELELGNHVGDWEHNMIRFSNGVPQAVHYSQHASGASYTYDAVPKSGNRILGFSGNGTHATWVTAGEHDHTIPHVPLPDGPLIDYTDNGPLWDPLKAAYFYSVTFPDNNDGDDSNPTFSALPNPIDSSIVSPVPWLYFQGQWGDPRLPEDDPRQLSVFDIAYKYEGGPNGPRFKGLNRVNVCNSDDDCVVLPFLPPNAR